MGVFFLSDGHEPTAVIGKARQWRYNWSGHDIKVVVIHNGSNESLKPW